MNIELISYNFVNILGLYNRLLLISKTQLSY